MKINWKTLIPCIAAPLIVGATSSFLSMGSMETFSKINKPAFSPPGWVFPVVWTILYIFMGCASYLVIESGGDETKIKKSMILYSVQLVLNFFWPILFFSFGLYGFSFLWLVVLWILVLLTAISFKNLSNLAFYLLIPYLVWIVFAGYLNFEIAVLN